MPSHPARPTTPLAATILERLTAGFTADADPVQAVAMRAYMRDQFPFLGIRGPMQQALARRVVAGLPRPAEADLHDIAVGCWELAEREYQYFACGLLRRHAKVCTAGFLDTARHLITHRSWWDTVDALAVHLVGPLVARFPEVSSTMDVWVVEENIWLVRTALLHQMRFKEATDATRLFHYCLTQSAHPDFFIRKAIGWALREYAKTSPEAVRTFVRAHETRLSSLSVREALKHL